MKLKINVDMYIYIDNEEQVDDALEIAEEFIYLTNQDNEMTGENVTISKILDYSIVK